MSKNSIESSVYKIMQDIIVSTAYEIVDVEYVKEGPFKYLKVYIDKPEGITVDDCSEISHILSKKLDELDFISEQYFLEVSSPGLERPFKTESDYMENINEKVEVKLYKPLDGKKVITGILLEKQENNIMIDSENQIITIELKDISKINRTIEDF
ncbi:ribosome maturation factor RimP [Sedimentibacter acidaminivorans]|jgi:ribosome maturation factor RimP|uniref:Ribosome maturation factor RimP n=1 Tax=Sedimentibacter acidaminivorans TaxID=913099 RepID=A0ABS4GC71_9FIRM|nr:ribosome maturation factor RimP [Sedimentibacter acidaminivorans]MBP1925289.1 ribosome maturation factor RimP [Sedimentibacter acidaminivorans]